MVTKNTPARRTVRVNVLDLEEGSSQWPPEPLLEFASWVGKLVSSVPIEHLASARIEFGSSVSHDMGMVTLEVWYYRPETDAEMQAREVEEQQAAVARRAKELRRLADLRAKYGE